ncbi:hypothetical protein D3877_28830 [Azospirillum cavernae]|uniref:PglD N-terminal domain-containing protein n=1 Tax=Azospirillum cavernae TaxID=2320860 RepID=A0A418VL54_9PROT|nr:hypothetical protein [Azospirillum cavernae]RJF76885.1 hypothetical protein D3877_28830 [Azospirillum cavernae]
MKTLSHPRRLKAVGPVYLFGAGGGGLIVKRAIEAAGRARVTAFVDRAPREEADGLPVLSSAVFLATGDRDATVVIASQHWEEISIQLSIAGFRRVWNAYPIIVEHLAPTRDRGTVAGERRRGRLKATGFAAAGALLLLLVLILGTVAG